MALPAGALPEIPGTAVVEVALPPAAAFAAAARAADEWGAELTPAPGEDGAVRGHLSLQATAGLRQGTVAGELAAEAAADGSRLVFRPEASEMRLHGSRVGLLVLGALGGLTLIVWPVFPGVLPLVPVGAVFAFGAWFLVVSRLHVSGPEELLDRAAELGEEPPGIPPEPPAL